MARRTRSTGLSIGAVLTLTLGFLAASLLIFVFGMWVGKDLVERRLAQEERVVRKPADRTVMTEAAPEPPAAVPPAAAPTAPVVSAWATPPTATPVLATATPAAAPPTNTKAAAPPTRTPRPTPPPKAGGRGSEWADAGWTVQVYATTDPGQATALARRLIAKGYDAYTLQAPMRGQTWYRVRVGRFADREKAAEMERKLKSLEKLEAAYVTAQ